MSPKKGTGIFFPSKDAEIVAFYFKAVDALALLKTKYNISDATMTTLQNHSVSVRTTLNQALGDVDRAKNSTEIKNKEFAQAKFDILNVFHQIQSAPNFAEEDADLLGFRVITEPIDYKKVKPVITDITILPDQVIIDWIKGRMEGVVIYSSYNGEDFSEIGRDTKSPFEDTRKNQTRQAETRYYKMRYFRNDKPVGMDSEISKVVVQVW